jgi:vacuolar-type H+-ATPase subunit I/STV1
MFFTYPLFFGLILGDILYGAATMGFGYFLHKRIGHTETGLLASKFIVYIGFSAVVFGYIYGEFAGYEILPHMQDGGWVDSHAPAWASWLTALYPNGGMIHWELSGPFGVVLAYPFHRVVPTSAGGNLEDLILLTIYMGVVHVLLGLLIGFRDIWLHGDSHGNTGPIIAIFDRGSWIIILFGGFMFCYGFLGLQNTPGDELLTLMQSYGAILAAAGILMLIYASYRYHGMPLLIAMLMGPIEGVGMMPTVISYVRLFAVGVAGVKIAETGNDMLYGNSPDPAHHVEGAGMLNAVEGLGVDGVEGLLLFVAMTPVLAAIAIKLFSKRLPSEASQFGLLHGMTASGILGMVLAGVETQTMGMVLSPLLIVPVLLQGLGSLGMLNTTLYGQVRLAELAVWFTGLALVGGVYMVVTLAFAWLGVQIFAWVLGLFSPNIHTARLHLVEWMKQFYEAVGDKFEPFGFTARVVEVE